MQEKDSLIIEACIFFLREGLPAPFPPGDSNDFNFVQKETSKVLGGLSVILETIATGVQDADGPLNRLLFYSGETADKIISAICKLDPVKGKL